jgi:sarcosine oxidase subunit alpha
LGGSGFYQLGNDPARRAVVKSLVDQVMSHANIEVRLNAYAASYYADYWVPLIDGEKMTKVRARSVIIASGAYEQPAVFRNNDLPGVMMASAAQRLVYRYAVQPAKTVVVLVANDDGYRAAIDMLAAGVKVAAVVDSSVLEPCSVVDFCNQVFDSLCYTYIVDRQCHSDVAHHLKILSQHLSQRSRHRPDQSLHL